MKRTLKWTAAILWTVVSNLAFSSCEDETRVETFHEDKSLAGSIYVPGYRFEADASFDGSEMEGFRYDTGFVVISKVSDAVISFFCYSEWNGTLLKIDIPEIPLTGKPYDVTFNCTTDQAQVGLNGNIHAGAHTTITGWIKRKTRSVFANSTRSRPAMHEYDCDITIETTYVKDLHP